MIFEKKIRRNYRPLQIVLDVFALFLLYLFFYSFIRSFLADVAYFNSKNYATEGRLFNPDPVKIWAVPAVLVFAAPFVLPFVYAKKTALSQKQYDLWVYAVMLIRLDLLVTLMCVMGEHMHILCPPAAESNPVSVLIGVVLFIIILRIMKRKIDRLEPVKKRRSITED